MGYTPVKLQGNSIWYKTPLREETDASFKVNTEINRWYNFGLGKGGNFIALAAELYRSEDKKNDCFTSKIKEKNIWDS